MTSSTSVAEIRSRSPIGSSSSRGRGTALLAAHAVITTNGLPLRVIVISGSTLTRSISQSKYFSANSSVTTTIGPTVTARRNGSQESAQSCCNWIVVCACSGGSLPGMDTALVRSSVAGGLRRWAATLVGGIALSFTISLAVPPAEANAAGCGPGILGRATEWKDRNRIYDFVAVCGWHDSCYGAKGFGWDGGRFPTKREVPYPKDWCDSGFLSGMTSSCNAFRPTPITNRLCRAVATAFHSLVRAFGGPSYRASNGHRRLLVLQWPRFATPQSASATYGTLNFPFAP